MYLALGFAVLLMIGYRNSQINEAFTYNQKLEKTNFKYTKRK